jgi:hypothetical protein
MGQVKSHLEKNLANKGCSFPIIDYYRNNLLDRELSMTWCVVITDQPINGQKF